MARIKLSPPWDTYYKELKCLFEQDKDITIIFDEEIPEIKLYVDSPAKAYALSELLPTTKEFGTVTMNITVVPSNTMFGIPNGNLYEMAFKDNPVLAYVKEVNTPFAGKITYVVFILEVVQYFNDNLFDLNGICSTLYQEIAKNIFEDNGHKASFCTEYMVYL